MEKDFKEKYIEQQKQQSMDRKARLAKIGMGTDVKEKAVRNNAPAVRAPQPAVPQKVRVAPTAPVQNKPQAHANVSHPAATQLQKPQRSANGGNPPAKNGIPAHQRRRMTNPAEVSVPNEKTIVNIPEKRRPAAPAANEKTVVFQKSESGQRRPQSQTRKKHIPTDEELFKKNLSENETKAMMLALTGEAKDPDDGGDVDIINIGMIPAPKKRDDFSKKKKSNAGKYVGRTFAAIGSFLLFAILAVYATVFLVAHGPSETMRNKLVQDAMQASATKWAPYLFLSSDTVDMIINESKEVEEEVLSKEDYETVIQDKEEEEVDKWATAKDGMIFETVNGSTYKAYVLLVKDPKRVFVGTSSDQFSASKPGINVFKAAERYNAVACINAGEFVDNGGGGTGSTPMGLTYSQGKCVWDDGLKRTFIGIDKNDKLIVCEPMTKKVADELGIRDAVSFQNGKSLITTNEKGETTLHRQDGNIGTAQRTAIGQREDGTIILIVTDGRSASSPGATHNDVIDLMVSYGAINAGMLDGGSSATMYYRDYFNKYDYDLSKLDQYQKKGLVNNYKAFTEPRYIPTFFVVAPEE